MITAKLKELTATRAKLASLEQSIASELNAELAALPGRYGFSDASSFIAAVTAATDGRRSRRGRPPGAGKKDPSPKRRKRAKITDAMRAEVKKLVEAGKAGGAIAKAVGISLPSVQNIKKALGLVKKGKKK